MPSSRYYIIFRLKHQAILSFLNVRVVVNNRDIYPLPWNQPVVVALDEENPEVVLTDGFHYSRPRQLHFDGPGYFNFEVVTPLSDWRIFKGGVVLSLFYIWATLTGFLLLKIASFLPIIVLLIHYYLNRRNFLQLKQVRRHY